MAALYAAQAGDVLTLMHATGLRYYQFMGQGEDVLEGVMQSSDIVGASIWSGSDLGSLRVLTLPGSFYRVGVFRWKDNVLSVPYLSPSVQMHLHTMSEMDAATVGVWFAWPIGLLTFAAPWTVVPRWLGTVAGAAAGGYGVAAMLNRTGNKEGDQKLFVQLVVRGPYFYSAQVVVRAGEVVVDQFYYSVPDPSLECTCCPFCP